MDKIHDRRKFLQGSLIWCSGIAGLISTPVLARGRSMVPAAARRCRTNEDSLPGPEIRVLGVGGGGCHAVNWMIAAMIPGVEFIAIDTDVSALGASAAARRVPIGLRSTSWQGCSDNVDAGCLAVEEDHAALAETIRGADLLFVVAGLGGRTGTGAASAIAAVARKIGVLTVAVVTTPFPFEGARRVAQAAEGQRSLEQVADLTIAIPLAGLTLSRKHTLLDAFRMADESSRRAVAGVSGLLTLPGFVGVGLIDIRAVIKGMPRARFGFGVGRNDNHAKKAMQWAIDSPLLGKEAIKRAGGVIVSLAGGLDATSLQDAGAAVRAIEESVGAGVQVLWGLAPVPELAGMLVATVVVGRASR